MGKIEIEPETLGCSVWSSSEALDLALAADPLR